VAVDPVACALLDCLWFIRAARRDMRSAACYVGRAEDRLKAAGLALPPLTGSVVPVVQPNGRSHTTSSGTMSDQLTIEE